MKYFDIIPPVEGANKLVAWIEYSVTRRKALSGRKIEVKIIKDKPGKNSYGRDGIPF